MNSITTALKSAGAPLPAMAQRAWQWVHDHPGTTAAQVNTAIKTPTLLRCSTACAYEAWS